MAIQKVKNKNGEWVIVSGVNKPLTFDSSLTNTSENPVKGRVIKEYIDYAIQNIENYIDNAVQNVDIDVDAELSDTSENPVQNKVIKSYIDNAVQNVEIDVDDTLSDESENPVQNKVVTEELSGLSTRIDETSNDLAELSDGVIINEEISAAAFADLDNRVNNNYSYSEATYATKEELEIEVSNINSIILENEEVITAALTDLNSRLETLLLRVTQLENA